ncbi:pneumococcal serine-rich repeat protein [Rosa sericea]
MEGIKGLGGGKVAIGVGNGVGHDQIIQDQDMGDGMQCSDHPYRNNPGGICAFCLQEKLGKLVSSSFPLPVRNSASSSSSPSFRSDITGATNAGGVSVAAPSSTSLSLSLSVRPKANGESFHHDEYYTRRARISFLLARKKKKVTANASSDSHSRAADMVFKRSKSTATPRRGHFMDAADDFSPRKRNGFWSFLYHHHKTSKKIDNKSFRDNSKISSSSSFASSATAATTTAAGRDKSLGSSLRNKAETAVGEVEDDSSPNSQATASASSFERKVSRSRSVGCGSRSFSGDFFERISTGFGDCTLRRVESQREGKPKHSSSSAVRNGAERVKCGGLFSGFMMTSSSSSSSSSSYWVSSSAEDMNGKPMSGGPGPLVHGRSRSSWGWAFASPMRAFSKPSSKDGKRDIVRQANTSDKNTVNTTPNLSAIPSLLSVRG